MFPFRDHNPSSTRPYVTWALIAANIVIFLATWPLAAHPRELASFYQSWGLVPAAVTQGGDWTGLLTAMFLHGGILHIAGNMLFLWVFGDNMEDSFGHAGYLAFYLVCGVAAGYTQVLVNPSSQVPTIGASGAIAGVLGGYILLYPRARVDVLIFLIIFFWVVTFPAWVVLGIWFALQLLAGVSGQADLVAHWAHIGGFIAGILLTLPIWLSRGGTRFWARNLGQPPHPETKYARLVSIPKIKRRR